MKKTIYLLVLPIAISTLIFSCKKTEVKPSSISSSTLNNVLKSDKNDFGDSFSKEDNSGKCNSCNYQTIVYNLLGNQVTSVGTLNVTNDARNLYVTYKSSTNWGFTSLSLYVGDYQNVPLNGFNPNVTLFPFQKVFATPRSVYKFTIQLSQLPSCYVISANATFVKVDSNGAILQTLNAWTTGLSSFDSRIFWTYNNYCTQVCELED